MCELFAFSGNAPRNLDCELREFFSHSSRHPNGWGLRIFDGPAACFKRQAECANESAALAELLGPGVVASQVFAHIRLSTVGADRFANCHPFVGVDSSGRTWTLIHNGTIFDEALLAKYSAVQQGTTDSERILLHLLALIDQEIALKGRDLSQEERFAVLDRLILGFGAENKVNLLVYDGELLYAHSNMEGTLHRRTGEGFVIFSTEPLSEGAWERAPFMQLVAYRQGELAFTGTQHSNQYFLDEERLERMLAAYRYL